ncbi:MAG: 16S rRNA processing protein RimM [Cyanobium sp. CACIAM 14]|nr:MAG: 16S rRNA processing protein RimM [Cyanobium sp. CACIAM 14]
MDAMMRPDGNVQAVADTNAPTSREESGEDPGELMAVGRLVAAQGLGGEVRVLPLSDFPERFTRPGDRWLQAPRAEPRRVRLLSGRPLPGKELFVLRLEGISDRTAAEALVGQQLLVPASDRPALEPGEFHLLDLVGLQVRLLEAPDTVLGTVTDLLHGGNDLLEVELTGPAAADGTPAASPRRILIPFVEAIVPVVNLAEGWIGLTPPPGLLDL